MNLVISKATLEDVPEIAEELKSFSEFYGTNKSMFIDIEQAESIAKNLIENHVFFIATSASGELIGFISGMIMPHIYNPNILTLVESFWWVKEKYRFSKAGLKLLNHFVEFGKENVDWIIMTVESKSPVKDQTFLKRGFRLQEKSFLLEVE